MCLLSRSVNGTECALLNHLPSGQNAHSGHYSRRTAMPYSPANNGRANQNQPLSCSACKSKTSLPSSTAALSNYQRAPNVSNSFVNLSILQDVSAVNQSASRNPPAKQPPQKWSGCSRQCSYILKAGFRKLKPSFTKLKAKFC